MVCLKVIAGRILAFPVKKFCSIAFKLFFDAGKNKRIQPTPSVKITQNKFVLKKNILVSGLCEIECCSFIIWENYINLLLRWRENWSLPVMKHLLFAGLFLSAVIYGPNIRNTNLRDSKGVQIVHDTSTIAGTWYLMPVLSSDTAAGKLPTLNFELTEGRFSGNNGCNAMSGSFFIKEDALRFGDNVVSTKMACPGYNEKLFVNNLLKTNRFMIKDGVLQLMYNTTILSKWTRVADTSASKKA